jgi:hypothetical protein
MSHVSERMTYGELEILANECVKAHDVYILNSLFLAYNIMETHGL